MSVTVRYGTAASLSIALDDERFIGVCGAADTDSAMVVGAAAPIDGSRFLRAVHDALEQPLEFPDLAQTVVVGDRVTIVVEPGVPRAADVVAAVAERITTGGVNAADITVLHGDDFPSTPIQVHGTVELAAAGRASAERATSESPTQTLRTERHDPADRGKLSFLANTRSGRPVYLNRLLTDADMVISIGCFRGADAWNYRGVFGAIYPTYSDTESMQRYRNAHLLDTDGDAFAKSQEEIDRVGWQSGIQATVQVVPGTNATAAIVAGEARAVARRAEQLWRSAWARTFPKRAELVVAALSGAESQTWQHVGRALAAALEVVEDGGAIALCTELAEPPGRAVEALARIEDRDVAAAEIRKARPLDAFPALLLDRAQRRVRVYLLSRLDAGLVEDLGIAPVEEPADIERLASRRKSCIVLCDAQYAGPRVG